MADFLLLIGWVDPADRILAPGRRRSGEIRRSNRPSRGIMARAEGNRAPG